MEKAEPSQHNFFYLPVGNLICLTVQMVDNFVVRGNSRHLKAPGFCCRSSFDQGRTVGCRILPQKPENVTLISRKKTTVIYLSAKKLISNWLESTPLQWSPIKLTYLHCQRFPWYSGRGVMKVSQFDKTLPYFLVGQVTNQTIVWKWNFLGWNLNHT